MKSAGGCWCDTHDNDEYPGCEHKAAVVWFCHVEGREVALCEPCNRAWRVRAKDDGNLAHRCPMCAHFWLAFHNPQATPAAATATHPAGSMLTGPLADAFDMAMFSEGLLVDVRQRVLRRLGSDERMKATMLHA